MVPLPTCCSCPRLVRYCSQEGGTNCGAMGGERCATDRTSKTTTTTPSASASPKPKSKYLGRAPITPLRGTSGKGDRASCLCYSRTQGHADSLRDRPRGDNQHIAVHPRPRDIRRTRPDRSAPELRAVLHRATR